MSRSCEELAREPIFVSHLLRPFIECAFYTHHTWGVVILKIVDHTINAGAFICFVHNLIFHVRQFDLYHVFICRVDFTRFDGIFDANTCLFLFLLNVVKRKCVFTWVCIS